MKKLIFVLALATTQAFGAYKYVRPITVPAVNVHGGGTLTNFPVSITGTFPYWATVANGGSVTSLNGYDIVFASDSTCTTLLNFDRAAWSATTGKSEFHVQIPVLSSSADNLFYECYGNSAITTDQATTATYDSSYLGVWHFGDGTTLSLNDSTANANNGTASGTPIAATGQVGGGALFDSVAEIRVPSSTSLHSPTTAVTLSAWVDASTLSQNNVAVIAAQSFSALPDGTGNANPFWAYYISVNDGSCPTNNISGFWDIAATSGSLRHVCSDPNFASPIVAGQWYYVVFTYNGTTGSIYVNGVLTSTSTSAGTLSYNNGIFWIGRNLKGVVDEVRAANVVRSANWIATEYDNQLKPWEFYTIGGLLSNSTQITNVTVDATNTQAVVHFTAPSNPGSCRVNVSQVGSMLPSVVDTDPTIFTAANLANRDGNIIQGNTVTAIIGRRYKAYYATAGDTSIRWSRALQASSPHRLDINCGGEEYEKPFVTATLPFGNTHADSIPADPNHTGNPMWQTWMADIRCDVGDTGCNWRGENRRIFQTVDPQTGVLMEPLVLPGDDVYHLPNNQFKFAIGSSWSWSGSFTSGGVNATTTTANPLEIVGAEVNGFTASLPTVSAYAVPAMLTFAVNATSSNAICDGTNNTDACKVEVCVSLNQVSCATDAQVYDMTINNASPALKIGTGELFDVLQKTNKRIWSRDQVALRARSVTCSGTTVTMPLQGEGFIPDILTAGSQVTIDNIRYTVASYLNALQFTTTTAPSPCTNIHYSGFTMLVWKKIANGDTLTLSTPMYSTWSTQDTLPQVNSGSISSSYNLTLPNGHNGSIIIAKEGSYALDLQTGDVYPYSSSSQRNNVPGGAPVNSVQMDNQGAYWQLMGDSSLVKIIYTGDYQRPFIRTGNGTTSNLSVPLWQGDAGDSLPDCGGGVTARCITSTTITGAGGLRVLLNGFDNRFSSSSNQTINPFQTWAFDGLEAGGVDGEVLSIDAQWFGSCCGGFEAWRLIFDPHATCNVNGTLDGSGNCIPGTYGGGCIGTISTPADGCIIAARQMWAGTGARWALNKGSIPIYTNSLSQDQPGSPAAPSGRQGGGTNVANIVGGVFSTVTCPTGGPTVLPTTAGATGAAATGCIQLTVDGDPYDEPTGTSSRGWLGTYAVGDYAHINAPLTVASFQNGFSPTNYPLLEIATITPAGGGQYTLVLACINANNCPTTSTPTKLYMVTNFPGTFPPWSTLCCSGGIGGAITWNYVADPHGAGVMNPDFSYRNGHAFYFGGVISNYDNSDDFAPVQPHYNQRDYRTLTPTQFLTAIGDFVNHEQFTGITALIGAWAGNTGNDAQDLNSHPDYGGVSTIASNPFLGVDGVVIGGTTAFPAPSSVHLATGATTTYRVNASFSSFLKQKLMDTQAASGPRVLQNISGPGVLITDGSGGSFTYCYVMVAGECWAGSLVGEVYFNIPNFGGLVTGINTTNSTCWDGGFQSATVLSDQWWMNDFCLYNAGVFSAHNRYRISGQDYFGWAKQNLGHNLMSPRADVFSAIQSVNLIKDATAPQWYWTYMQYLDGRFATMLLKGPTFEPDSMDQARTTFATVNVSLKAAIGATSAGVEIAYDDYNGYCSPNRAETCVAVGTTVDQTTPFYWETTESGLYTPLACSTSCTVAVPILWGHVARLTPVYFSGSTVVSRGATQIIPVQ